MLGAFAITAAVAAHAENAIDPQNIFPKTPIDSPANPIPQDASPPVNPAPLIGGFGNPLAAAPQELPSASPSTKWSDIVLEARREGIDWAIIHEKEDSLRTKMKAAGVSDQVIQEELSGSPGLDAYDAALARMAHQAVIVKTLVGVSVGAIGLVAGFVAVRRGWRPRLPGWRFRLDFWPLAAVVILALLAWYFRYEAFPNGLVWDRALHQLCGDTEAKWRCVPGPP